LVRIQAKYNPLVGTRRGVFLHFLISITLEIPSQPRLIARSKPEEPAVVTFMRKLLILEIRRGGLDFKLAFKGRLSYFYFLKIVM